MSAIDFARRCPAGRCLSPKIQKGSVDSGAEGPNSLPGSAFLVAAWTALFLCLFLGSSPTAFGAVFQVTPAAQITMDSDGLPLRFPSALHFDNTAEELYLFTGGRAQVVVYGSDFFPLVSMGPGRGVETPQGGFVDHAGLVYVCQSPTDKKPARITVLNGAFIVVREIFFDKIPEAPDFVPRRLVVGRGGTLYVANWQYPGVLVLDNEGAFLRWLRPVDQIVSAIPQTEADVASAESAKRSVPPADLRPKESFPVDIPEEFRPRTKSERETSTGPRVGPVYIRSVATDGSGNLYLLSSQTSKTYVYGPDEVLKFSFGSKGGTPGRLSQPRGVAIDENRKLMYVVDYMRHSVLTFDKTGRWLFEFGGKGDDPGWFNFPTDIVVNRRGQIIVSDLFNHRVQVLDVKYEAEYPVADRPQRRSSPVGPINRVERAAPDSLPTETPNQ